MFDQAITGGGFGGTAEEHADAAIRFAGNLPGWNIEASIPDIPDCPLELEHVLEWFFELSAARREGMSGPGAITHADIVAWSELTGRGPDPFEVKTLLVLDGEFRSVVSKHNEAKRTAGNGAPKR